jgi:hypothetical protein
MLEVEELLSFNLVSLLLRYLSQIFTLLLVQQAFTTIQLFFLALLEKWAF